MFAPGAPPPGRPRCSSLAALAPSRSPRATASSKNQGLVPHAECTSINRSNSRVMPVENRSPPTDMRDQQIGIGILVVCGVQLGDRPRLRNGRRRRHALMPFQRARQRGVVAEEHDVVIAPDAGGSAPLDAGIADQSTVVVDVATGRDDVGPDIVGDLKVVGGVADHVQRADVASVGQVPRACPGCLPCRWNAHADQRKVLAARGSRRSDRDSTFLRRSRRIRSVRRTSMQRCSAGTVTVAAAQPVGREVCSTRRSSRPLEPARRR